jgi:type II secretory pathway component PulC
MQRMVAFWIAALLGRTGLPSIAEFTALRPATRALLAGFSGWIALVVLITAAAVVSIELSTVNLPEWLGASSSTSRSAVARPPANFENILQRPLFSRNRQGVTLASLPVPAPPPMPSTLDQGITLKGVFISGSLAKAFLLSTQNPLGVWVQADEEISGWKVVAVEPDHVIVQGQGEKRSVQLNFGGGK